MVATTTDTVVMSIRQNIKTAVNMLDWITINNRIMEEVADESTRKSLYKEMKNAIQRTKTNLKNTSYPTSNETTLEEFANNEDITIGYVLEYCRKKAQMSETRLGKELNISISCVRAAEKGNYWTGDGMPTYRVLMKYVAFFNIDMSVFRTIMMHTPMAALFYWDEMWEGTNTMSCGAMLKNIRLLKDMTALEVSQALGIQQPNYTRIENGKKTSLKRLVEILEVLDETTDSFLVQISRYTDMA